MKKAVITLIKIYKKLVSPFLARSCRFHPSCSEYAIEAVQTHGVIAGVIKATWRILRCNPLSKGGYDPVIKEKQQDKIPEGNYLWKKD